MKSQQADAQSNLNKLQDEVATMLAAAKAREDAAKQREDAADAARKAAEIQTTLSQISQALENGTPFEDSLGTLQQHGVDPSAALTNVAASGVKTESDLAAAFPAAARNALQAARSAEVESSPGSGFSAFLKSSLGTRSLTPREGNSPDAVLSRAQAAVDAGDLQKALTETDALPEMSQKQMADWRTAVQTRLAAVNAVAKLNEQQK